MSNTPSLLPCPLCGKTHSLIVGAASEAWDADEHGPYPHTESYAVFCDASTDGRRGGCGGAGGYRLTKDEAIEVWNRRTPQPVVREPLTDEQSHALLERMATEADQWAEGLSYEPTRAQLSGWCVAFIQREIQAATASHRREASMALKVTHDGSAPSDVRERCCMCRKKTPYWHRSDVALCPECAKTTKLAELPTKAEWCAKEEAIFKKAMGDSNGL